MTYVFSITFWVSVMQVFLHGFRYEFCYSYLNTLK